MPRLRLINGNRQKRSGGADVPNPIRDILDHPACPEILDAARALKRLGFDPAKPEMLERAMQAGVAEFERKRVDAAAREEFIRTGVQSVGRKHAPVVYYMVLGSLIKIGTSTNIRQRCLDLSAEVVLAVELGDSRLEHQRHREFARLRVVGEWFVDVPELRRHIGGVRSRFESETGHTTWGWLKHWLPAERLPSDLRRVADQQLDIRERSLHHSQ